MAVLDQRCILWALEAVLPFMYDFRGYLVAVLGRSSTQIPRHTILYHAIPIAHVGITKRLWRVTNLFAIFLHSAGHADGFWLFARYLWRACEIWKSSVSLLIGDTFALRHGRLAWHSSLPCT